jgi:ELWxxDGT repeat protein
MARKAALVTLFSLLVFVQNLSSAGTPQLALDINPVATPLSSSPFALGRLGNTALFRVDLSIPGVTRGALVKSDGTPAGTATLRTFAGHGPADLAMTLGTRAFFSAEENGSGYQLWVTDGTADGTRQVTSFAPAQLGMTLRLIGTFGNDLLFARHVDGAYFDLYRSDGTPAGTTRIATVTSYSHLDLIDVAVVGNRIYFLSTDTNTGQLALWVSDGTAAGTHIIPAVNALDTSVGLQSLRPLGDGVVLLTNTSSFGSELTRVDASGVASIIDLTPGPASGAASLTSIDGYAYFAGSTTGNDFELWRSDGTPAGTVLVKDINPGATTGIDPQLADILQVGTRMVFAADDGSGVKLWGSDGTAAGTLSLTSVVSFPTDAFQNPIATSSTRYQYIRAFTSGPSSTTIITDGTQAGTGIIPPAMNGDSTYLIQATGDGTTEYISIGSTDQATGVSSYEVYKFTPPSQYTSVYSHNDTIGMDAFVYVNGKVLFDGFDTATGRELRVIDENGNRLVQDFTPQSSTAHSRPAWFTDWNGKAVFVANDGSHGDELWISDGTASGTRLLADILPGGSSSDSRLVTVWNGALYFFAHDGTTYRLMRLTSPDATPEILANVSPPPRINDTAGSEPVRCLAPNAVPLGNKLLFTARTVEAGTELWSTDGTAAGTAMVMDINAALDVSNNPMGSQPCGLTLFQNRAYFSATGSADGTSGLWSSDGTAAGTARFGNLLAGGPFLYNNELYFVGTDTTGTLGSQTWKTDGTVAGTRPLVTATNANETFRGIPVGITNGKLIFYISHSAPLVPPTYTLWASDGTAAPVQLSSFNLGGGLLARPDRLYFTTSTGGDEEPWVSDGTPAGTRRLADLDSAGSSHPYRYVDFRGVVLIMTNDAAGPHVWRTDGTESGTVQLGKIPPRSNGVFTVGVAGQNVFFSGVDSLLGEELFVIPNNAPVAVADTASAANGLAVTINVLSNDADPDGSLDASTTLIAQAPAHGTASVGANGVITYTPATAYSGSDIFVYTVADTQGHVSNVATVTVSVTAAPSSGSNGGGSGSGGGGPLNWYEVLLLAGFAGWKLAGHRGNRRDTWAQSFSRFATSAVKR